MKKILHVAPQNYAGVPYDFFSMHNACGDSSRLISLHKNPLSFKEDICLDFPLPDFDLAKKWRRKKVSDMEETKITSAPIFKSKNMFESLYYYFSDISRSPKVDSLIQKLSLDDYDIIHFDGGLDFYRSPKQALKWKAAGKKIVCCYYGSDLRIRGLIPELDKISDLNITSEYDHLALKKDLKYIFYPYNTNEVPAKVSRDDDKIVVVHSPTNRKYKGTDLIIKVMNKICGENKKVEFVLIENRPRTEVLEAKNKCDICIDQVGGTMGGTGYGKAGIETLAMGIPVITNMTKEYQDWLPENPFSVANNEEELYSSLNELISDLNLRSEKGSFGKKWVEKYHGFGSVNNQLFALYKEAGII